LLIGEYTHNIDSKKRFSIPAKMRKEIGDRAYLTKGLDSCLFLYPLSEWQKLAEKLTQLPAGRADIRDLQRTMLGGAVEVEMDALGRILVPEYLKQHAGLKQKVVIAGLYNRCEIWDEEKWNQRSVSAEKNADMIAEKLGELGMF
jgi:MraZ protein